ENYPPPSHKAQTARPEESRPKKATPPATPQPFNPKLKAQSSKLKAQKSRCTPFKNPDQGFKTNNINLTHLLYFSDTGQGTTLHQPCPDAATMNAPL
ncbi:hypothetical protein, partial [Alcaligenes phenolicus]|uniref:hypothetical protein n=1 Tax=Alcaligenes phenolicus TaxID=232846 RepID=UPI002C0D7C88